jgi:hypothetical protein
MLNNYKISDFLVTINTLLENQKKNCSLLNEYYIIE